MKAQGTHHQSRRSRIWGRLVAGIAVGLLALAVAAPLAGARVTSGSFKIDAGAAFTSTTAVTLNLGVTGGTQMRFRDAGGAWSSWVAYAATTAWTLPAGDGTKTVEVQYRTASAKSYSKSDSIVLDATAPAVTGTSSSTQPSESVWYSTSDAAFSWTCGADLSGVGGASYTLDADPAGVPDTLAETAGSTASFSDVEDGVWYFHVRPIDVAGNCGATQTRIVRIDATAPGTSDDYDGLPHSLVTVRLSAQDAASGVAGTSYRVDHGAWTSGSSVMLRASIRHKISGLKAGSHLLEYYSTDNAGNAGSIVSRTITLS